MRRRQLLLGRRLRFLIIVILILPIVILPIVAPDQPRARELELGIGQVGGPPGHTDQDAAGAHPILQLLRPRLADRLGVSGPGAGRQNDDLVVRQLGGRDALGAERAVGQAELAIERVPGMPIAPGADGVAREYCDAGVAERLDGTRPDAGVAFIGVGGVDGVDRHAELAGERCDPPVQGVGVAADAQHEASPRICGASRSQGSRRDGDLEALLHQRDG